MLWYKKIFKISKKFYFFNFQLFIQKNSKCFEIINEDNIIKKFLKIQFSFSKSSIVSYDIKERYKPSWVHRWKQSVEGGWPLYWFTSLPLLFPWNSVEHEEGGEREGIRVQVVRENVRPLKQWRGMSNYRIN